MEETWKDEDQEQRVAGFGSQKLTVTSFRTEASLQGHEEGVEGDGVEIADMNGL